MVTHQSDTQAWRVIDQSQIDLATASSNDTKMRQPAQVEVLRERDFDCLLFVDIVACEWLGDP